MPNARSPNGGSQKRGVRAPDSPRSSPARAGRRVCGRWRASRWRTPRRSARRWTLLPGSRLTLTSRGGGRRPSMRAADRSRVSEMEHLRLGVRRSNARDEMTARTASFAAARRARTDTSVFRRLPGSVRGFRWERTPARATSTTDARTRRIVESRQSRVTRASRRVFGSSLSPDGVTDVYSPRTVLKRRVSFTTHSPPRAHGGTRTRVPAAVELARVTRPVDRSRPRVRLPAASVRVAGVWNLTRVAI